MVHYARHPVTITIHPLNTWCLRTKTSAQCRGPPRQRLKLVEIIISRNSMLNCSLNFIRYRMNPLTAIGCLCLSPMQVHHPPTSILHHPPSVQHLPAHLRIRIHALPVYSPRLSVPSVALPRIIRHRTLTTPILARLHGHGSHSYGNVLIFMLL